MSIHGEHAQAPAARVYISGPISGALDGNRAAFGAAESLIKDCSHIPVNPQKLDHEHEGPCRGIRNVRHADDTRPEPHLYGCYMAPDLRALLDCDMIVMLAGWTGSRGARLEHDVADACGLDIVLPSQYLPGALRLWRENRLAASLRRPAVQDTQDAMAPVVDNV